MAENLTNKHIYETYHGLIKTGDNLPIDGTLKVLSDGDGNELPISVSEDTTKFKETSTVDFTDVTIVGITGVQGPQGPQGFQGTNGSNGAQGSQGPQGSNGSNGDQGAQGPQGFQGRQGTAGTNGVQGAQGPQGFQGQNGTNGVQGAQGPQGFQGTGVQGAQGVQGPQGFQGPQGQNGISAGKLFYFNQSQNSDVSPYKVLSDTPVIGAQQTVSKTLTGNQQDVLVQEFLTPQLGFTVIPAGVQRFKLYYTITPSAADIDAYVTIELANSTGTGYGTIVEASPIKIQYNDGQPSETDIDVVFPSAAINATDRIIVKLYLNNLDGVSRTVVWSTEDGYYSYVITSVGVTGNQGPQGPQGFQGSQGVAGPANLYVNEGSDIITTRINNIPSSNVNNINISTDTNGIYSLTNQTISIGFDSANNSDGGIYIGRYGSITGPGSTLVGMYSFSNGDGDVIFGNGNIAAYSGSQLNTNHVIVGKNNTVPDGLIEAYIFASNYVATDSYTFHTRNIKADSLKIAGYGEVINGAGEWVGPVTGIQGPQGPQGVIGADGAQGVQGPQGVNGSNGAQGAQGPQGTNGADGAQGAQGPQGIDGATGPQGAQGSAGSGSTTYINSIDVPATLNGGTIPFYKLNVPVNTFAITAFSVGAAGQIRYTPVLSLSAGEVINEVAVYCNTAVAGSTLRLGLYSVSFNAAGNFYASTLLTTFGDVDTSTTGRKTITSVGYTIPSSVMGTFYVGLLQLGGATAAAIAGPSNTNAPVYYGSLDTNTQNRGMSITGASGQTTLPSTISEATWATYQTLTTYAFIGFK